MKKIAPVIMLTLLLIGMWTLAFNIQQVSSQSMEPPEIEWSRTYGGTGDDDASYVIQTNDARASG